MTLMDLSHKPTNNLYIIHLNTLIIFQDTKNVKRYVERLYDFFNKYYPNKKSSLNFFYRKILQNKKYNERKPSIEDKIFMFPTNTRSHSKNNHVNQICIMDYKNKILKINLNNYLTGIDAVQFYKRKIVPILNVSKAFDIDFTKRIPFEYFGADGISEISDYSFTSYYKYLLNYCGINVNDATTKEISDGKYEMKINNQIIDVRAWDKIEDVLDNVDTILEIIENKELIEEIQMN